MKMVMLYLQDNSRGACMKEFLAKSNPKETIQEHTDNLIKNYELLKEIYPNLEIDWDILYLA